MFFHLYVSHSVHKATLGRHPPGQTLPGQTHHPWADTPLGRHPASWPTPPSPMATEAGGTHPTAMHSWLIFVDICKGEWGSLSNVPIQIMDSYSTTDRSSQDSIYMKIPMHFTLSWKHDTKYIGYPFLWKQVWARIHLIGERLTNFKYVWNLIGKLT